MKKQNYISSLNKSTLNKKLNEYMNELFDDNECLIHLLFQIIVVVSLINLTDDKNVSIQDYNQKYLLMLLLVILIFDYYIWNNRYQSLLFGVLIIGYYFYSRQQKKMLKEFYKNILDQKKQNNNNLGINYLREIPNPNVLDFEPDNIHKYGDEVKPFNLTKSSNEIEDTLIKLPKTDYSNTEFGMKNKTILDALDDKHTIKLSDHHQELARLNEFKKGKMLDNYDPKKTNDRLNNSYNKKHESTIDKWNLDRYYPKCKTINDYPLFVPNGINNNNNNNNNKNDKTIKISNKLINYCTNLPEVNPEQYKMISNNKVELIYKDNPHMQVFPKQYDIGGQGIVNNDFRENSSLV